MKVAEEIVNKLVEVIPSQAFELCIAELKREPTIPELELAIMAMRHGCALTARAIEVNRATLGV